MTKILEKCCGRKSVTLEKYFRDTIVGQYAHSKKLVQYDNLYIGLSIMSDSTQLNINIDQNLMKQIKQNSLMLEMSIGSYVNIIQKYYLTKKDLEDHN